jgi:hypothetical protein
VARRNPLLPPPVEAKVTARSAAVPVPPATVSAPVTAAEYPPLDLIAAKSTADMQDGVGSVVAAVVAPKEGPINVTPGTPVVLIAKRLRESPTFKKLWRAIVVAWSAFWLYVIGAVLLAGGPFELNKMAWLSLLKDASYPALLTAAGVYGITLKVKDNDPIVSGSLAAGPEK